MEVHLAAEKEARLQDFASRTGRRPSQLDAEAVDRMLEYDARLMRVRVSWNTLQRLRLDGPLPYGRGSEGQSSDESTAIRRNEDPGKCSGSR